MRRILQAALIATVLAGPVSAQDRESEIRDVISRQIEAFEADDFESAFAFASPTIRQMFGNPDRFGRMVVEGYPMVWRPAELSFSALEERDGRTVQTVLVTDGEGVLHRLEYEMIPGEDGWRINGVRLLRPADVGA